MSARLDELRRAQPKSRFMRASLWALAALTAYAWLSGTVEVGELFTERRLTNLRRFLTVDVVPQPARDGVWVWSDIFAWVRDVLDARGWAATLATLSISVVAIVLAGAMSWLLAPLAASNLATRRPFDADPGQERATWRALRFVVRGVMIVSRAVPEYVVAFLLLAVLGPDNAWPAILALAIHNGGILGRLGAETIENLEPGPLRSLSAIGAPRRAILATGVFPLALGRYLLFFFYRFETCVREATVLGMLGVVSLGYWIQDARAKQYYDEMLLFVALGALIVLVADLVSALARRHVRGAS